MIKYIEMRDIWKNKDLQKKWMFGSTLKFLIPGIVLIFFSQVVNIYESLNLAIIITGIFSFILGIVALFGLIGLKKSTKWSSKIFGIFRKIDKYF
jgi:glucan phosphoethanolaminetransferase (alkaline phosphatase superfamily)